MAAKKRPKPWTTIDVTKPVPDYIVIGPCWYLCIDGDPTQALFYKGMPQRNRDRHVMDMLLNNSLFTGFSNLTPVFLEISFSPQYHS